MARTIAGRGMLVRKSGEATMATRRKSAVCIRKSPYLFRRCGISLDATGNALISKPRATGGVPRSYLGINDRPAATGIRGKQNALAGDNMLAAAVGCLNYRYIEKDHLAQ